MKMGQRKQVSTRGKSKSRRVRAKSRIITLPTLKKRCWRAFSLYIRMRDCLKTTGDIRFGKCITCGRLCKITESDAGHFISRRFNSTLFDEKNVHLQCKQCNAFGGNLLEYRRQIVKLYGENGDTSLEDKATEIKKFTRQELEELTDYYNKKVAGFIKKE